MVDKATTSKTWSTFKYRNYEIKQMNIDCEKTAISVRNSTQFFDWPPFYNNSGHKIGLKYDICVVLYHVSIGVIDFLNHLAIRNIFSFGN